MKLSFYNPDMIRMEAENEEEIGLLTRIAEMRQTCSFRVSACQFDIKPGTQPGLQPVNSIDVRLQNAPNSERP